MKRKIKHANWISYRSNTLPVCPIYLTFNKVSLWTTSVHHYQETVNDAFWEDRWVLLCTVKTYFEKLRTTSYPNLRFHAVWSAIVFDRSGRNRSHDSVDRALRSTFWFSGGPTIWLNVTEEWANTRLAGFLTMANSDNDKYFIKLELLCFCSLRCVEFILVLDLYHLFFKF